VTPTRNRAKSTRISFDSDAANVTKGGSRGPGSPYFWQSQFYFLHCIQCLKNIVEIKFGFYIDGRNPRSFWKCVGVCVCV